MSNPSKILGKGQISKAPKRFDGENDMENDSEEDANCQDVETEG